MNVDLGDADRITSGAIGEPGQRTFYVQVRAGDRLVTITAEKQQVVGLASMFASILKELKTRMGIETGGGPGEEDMNLESPIDPLWRLGRLGFRYDEERGRIFVRFEELLEEDAEEFDDEGEPDDVEVEIGVEDEPPTDRDMISCWVSREQAAAFARHGMLVAARGRPLCEYCGNPIEGEHRCPAMNGHGPK